MKKLLYLFTLIFSFSLIGQNKALDKYFTIDLVTIEKNTKDTLVGSFTEVYSGQKRINASCCTNFDGIHIFYLKQRDIVDNTIYIKIYGQNCKPYMKKFSIKSDLKKVIYLEYGKTDYNNKDKDFNMMFEKLNIKPDSFECGTTE